MAMPHWQSAETRPTTRRTYLSGPFVSHTVMPDAPAAVDRAAGTRSRGCYVGRAREAVDALVADSHQPIPNNARNPTSDLNMINTLGGRGVRRPKGARVDARWGSASGRVLGQRVHEEVDERAGLLLGAVLHGIGDATHEEQDIVRGDVRS